MRWLLLVLAIIGFALTFMAKGPGVLALGLVLGFVGFFGLIFALAADRVSASSRPETAMLGAEDLAAMRARQTGARPRPIATAPAKPAAVAPVAAPKSAPPANRAGT
ncbi:MAG: hypothetical protein ABW186_03265 [Rhodanobacteraceae bacterium]